MGVKVRDRKTLWIIELALIAAAVGTALFGVIRPLIGPGGLGIGRGYVFGAPPKVDVSLEKGPDLRVFTEPSLPLSGGADRTIGAAEGTEFAMPFGTTVSVWSPDLRQTVGLVGGPVLAALVTIAALVILVLIVHSFRYGKAFVPANSSRLFLITAVMGLGGQAAAALVYWGHVGVLQHPAVEPYVLQDAQMSFLPLMMGLGILLLAEVFRQGVALQHEVDQTV